MKAKKSRLQPGIIHGMRRMVIEEVTKRHKKSCAVCDEPPRRRRLVVVSGSGRAAKTIILCDRHGEDFLQECIADANRGAVFLRRGEGCARYYGNVEKWVVAVREALA